MSAQILSNFTFEDRSIRVYGDFINPLFVAKDICDALSIQNVTQALQSLASFERSMLNIGRQGSVNVVTESGLYTLILRCRDAVKEGAFAYRFRLWVTQEVLPTIRKTGQYSTAEQSSEVPTLTPAQQLAIQQAVGRRAQKTANHYQTIYRAIKLRYQIARYDQLPQSLFEDCLKFIETVDLHVPEAPAPVQETRLVQVQPKRDILTRLECERLLGFVYEFKYLHKKDLDAIYELLKVVHSPLAASFWELKEGNRI